MSIQLRLVEAPEKKPRATRARSVKVPKARRAHWAADWRLDANTRRAGQAGVRAAREVLAQARRPASDLPRAS